MQKFIILLVLLLLPAAASAQDVSPRCEAAVNRAAGHYSQCLLSADASFARHGNPTKLEKRQARCETRFDRRTSRAINRHGADACPSSDLVAAIADRTVTYTEGVATESKGTRYTPLLFVQSATSGTLTQTTLTLTGVNPRTAWFTDRPYRQAGQNSTAGFVLFWDEGASSFADIPPNADFTCESDEEVKNYIVELNEPSLDWDGTTLTYAVSAVGDSALPEELECGSEAILFIDSLDCSNPMGPSAYACSVFCLPPIGHCDPTELLGNGEYRECNCSAFR